MLCSAYSLLLSILLTQDSALLTLYSHLLCSAYSLLLSVLLTQDSALLTLYSYLLCSAYSLLLSILLTQDSALLTLDYSSSARVTLLYSSPLYCALSSVLVTQDYSSSARVTLLYSRPRFFTPRSHRLLLAYSLVVLPRVTSTLSSLVDTVRPMSKRDLVVCHLLRFYSRYSSLLLATAIYSSGPGYSPNSLITLSLLSGSSA
ncbi:unnamed protein product [Owenia fusiformis]|uniref:Uncharacterized protein n=1 Tax=Owenia fusiformis TaxID=6347 RepID=A0A8S4P7J1_OWEFU|nr:unnamed protein product [Owenia fusiformis]